MWEASTEPLIGHQNKTVMKALNEVSKRSNEIKEVGKCLATFFFIAIALILIANALPDKYLRFVVLLMVGWLTWTFTEYALHRFWMHNIFKTKGNKFFDIHMEHHKHPREIKIKKTHRTVTFAGAIVLIVISIYLNNYFTVFTGFYFGFLLYSLLHVVLHKPWSRYIMPNLQRAHIHHHGKYPDKGFSFSMILWDWMFDTLPPKDAKITKKMLEFYFKEEDHDHLHGKRYLI
jgi:sterol desaturase/sphingolipid hydroxylase (fatty acid hydroxylase superfamily)